MKVNSNELPDEQGNPFLTIVQLLDVGRSLGQLATAIETDGIYSWDRFGRYRKFSSKSPEVKRCLDLLATERELRMSGVAIDDMFDNELERYGWAASVLPAEQGDDLAALVSVAESGKKVSNSALLVISAFMKAQGIMLDHNAAAAVQRLTELNSAQVGAQTIRDLLRSAEEAAARKRP